MAIVLAVKIQRITSPLLKEPNTLRIKVGRSVALVKTILLGKPLSWNGGTRTLPPRKTKVPQLSRNYGTFVHQSAITDELTNKYLISRTQHVCQAPKPKPSFWEGDGASDGSLVRRAIDLTVDALSR